MIQSPSGLAVALRRYTCSLGIGSGTTNSAGSGVSMAEVQVRLPGPVFWNDPRRPARQAARPSVVRLASVRTERETLVDVCEERPAHRRRLNGDIGPLCAATYPLSG